MGDLTWLPGAIALVPAALSAYAAWKSRAAAHASLELAQRANHATRLHYYLDVASDPKSLSRPDAFEAVRRLLEDSSAQSGLNRIDYDYALMVASRTMDQLNKKNRTAADVLTIDAAQKLQSRARSLGARRGSND